MIVWDLWESGYSKPEIERIVETRQLSGQAFGRLVLLAGIRIERCEKGGAGLYYLPFLKPQRILSAYGDSLHTSVSLVTV